MIRNSADCSTAAEAIAAAAFFVLVLAAAPGAAQTSGCNRAQAMVDEVATMPAASRADHLARLAKLRTAAPLCQSLAEIWRLSYCSAAAVGDEDKASFYRKRALLSGATSLDCGAPGAPAAPRAAPLPGHVRQKFALVVGVGRFRDPRIPTLRYTAKDARDLAAVLVDHAHFLPHNVTLLTDEEATRANILKGLQQLVLQAREDDLVLLYVSSHGSPYQKSQGLGGIGYLVTHDSSLDNIFVDAIEYQDFARKTALIKARRTVTFLDTCFSGQAFEGGGAKQLAVEGVGVDEKTAAFFVSGEGDFVITSSRGDERSWESDRLGNSYFTYYLVEALKRAGEPPTIREIFDELSYQVTRAVAADKGVGQHPQIHPGDGPSDVRIGVIPKLSVPVENP